MAEQEYVELLALAAALARQEVPGYALVRLAACSTDEDGHVDDWDYEPLFDTDEAPLNDDAPAYREIVAAYLDWRTMPALRAQAGTLPEFSEADVGEAFQGHGGHFCADCAQRAEMFVARLRAQRGGTEGTA